MRKLKRSSCSLPSQLQSPRRSLYCLTASRQLLRSACIHPSIHSLAYSIIHSLTHSLIHSFIRSFVRSFTHSIIHSIIRSFIHDICSFVEQVSFPKIRYNQSCVFPCMSSVCTSCLVILNERAQSALQLARLLFLVHQAHPRLSLGATCCSGPMHLQYASGHLFC